jgi:hypothetical protein
MTVVDKIARYYTTVAAQQCTLLYDCCLTTMYIIVRL